MWDPRTKLSAKKPRIDQITLNMDDEDGESHDEKVELRYL